jgi:hypothetical protein
VADELKKKNISIGSFLAKFFAFVTIGGIFLSFGVVGVYRLMNNLPLKISPLVIIISLVLGLILDGLAISYFLKNREEFFNELFKDK